MQSAKEGIVFKSRKVAAAANPLKYIFWGFWIAGFPLFCRKMIRYHVNLLRAFFLYRRPAIGSLFLTYLAYTKGKVKKQKAWIPIPVPIPQNTITSVAQNVSSVGSGWKIRLLLGFLLG